MELKQEANRFSYLEKGKEIAYITFPFVDTSIVCINHTYVDEAYRGRNLAGSLLKEVCEFLRRNEFKVIPRCSYAVEWLSRHKEYEDILK